MDTLRQIKDELPLLNKIHIKQPRLRKILGVSSAKTIQADVPATKAYIKENTVAAKAGRKCVDGRYKSTDATGMIARAGGDCGYVMALMAISKKKKLGLTPEQCFNEVYRVIHNTLHGAFCVHTDHHVDPEGTTNSDHVHKTIIGCGHLSKAASQRFLKRYDLENNDVKKIIAYVRNVAEIDKNIAMINLDGEHKEQGVLVIKSNSHTVNATDGKHMYFVYDKLRDDEFMRELVQAMNIPGVTYADMKKESDIQLNATLHNLAKGLPIYEVTYTNDEPQVRYLSTIS